MISVRIHIAMMRAFLCLCAFSVFACSMMPSNPLENGGGPRGMDSFMGVGYGASFDEVERRFPMGMTQTSPYGAPAYKLENVSSNGIEYQNVIYEFAEKSGMQMVVAHFPPSAAADVYQQLQNALGAPSSGSETNAERPSAGEASWHLSDGTRVLFSGPYHRVVLIGKDGGGLETDIHLRDQYIPLS